MSSSPRSPGDVSPRTPSGLRNELAAAKKAIDMLKQDKASADDKLEKVQAVLEKERNGLRDVLAAARIKVDELAQDIERKTAEVNTLTGTVEERDAEIERLKALLKAQQNQSTAASEQREQASGAQGAELARLREELARLRDVNQEQTQRLNDLQRSGGDKESLMNQLSSLREQLQNQSKLFSEQMDNGRKREEELRAQLIKQRQDLNGECTSLRQQLSRALENENAHKVDQLSKMLTRVRHECALRAANTQLLRRRNITFVVLFHFWAHHTQQVNAEKRLSEEARYKLEQARLKAEGKMAQFAATPLQHTTHMQTRHEAFDTHRYELWDNMNPRTTRGDARDSNVPGSSPRSSTSNTRSRSPSGGFLGQSHIPIGRSLLHSKVPAL